MVSFFFFNNKIWCEQCVGIWTKEDTIYVKKHQYLQLFTLPDDDTSFGKYNLSQTKMWINKKRGKRENFFI